MRIVATDNEGPLGTGNNLLEEDCLAAMPTRFAYN